MAPARRASIPEPSVATSIPIRMLSTPTPTQPPVCMTVLPPTAAPALLSDLRPNLPPNADGPEHRVQVNEQLLFEKDFHGNCYVSAHLQRLQHGIFADSVLHGERPLRVTFMAITFVLHPTTSMKHRFQSAVIELTAHTHDQEPLRFIKFAPHLAYGRISSETLKWSFQLGATVGVSQGPANLSVTPSMSKGGDKVLGAMMKIQGSTRSSQHHKLARAPDTKLVWSLEENDQQEAGLPREFTFAFLLARPEKRLGAHARSVSMEEHGKGKGDRLNNSSRDASAMTATAPPPSHPQGYHGLDAAATFGPLHLGIRVKPVISNVLNHLPFEGEYEETLVGNEVGQRLLVGNLVANADDAAAVSSPDDGPLARPYYNFAKMPGSFEDLVELPGNSVTSVEPSLPSRGPS